MNSINADTESEGGVAQIHAAIEHSKPNQQYAVPQTPIEFQGIAFNILIDLGATHSFNSPSCVSKLSLPSFQDLTLTVKLTMGKTTRSLQTVGSNQFEIGGYKTQATFRVLPLCTYEGIIGMDWLVKHKDVLECHSGKLKFQDKCNQEAKVFGN